MRRIWRSAPKAGRGVENYTMLWKGFEMHLVIGSLSDNKIRRAAQYSWNWTVEAQHRVPSIRKRKWSLKEFCTCDSFHHFFSIKLGWCFQTTYLGTHAAVALKQELIPGKQTRWSPSQNQWNYESLLQKDVFKIWVLFQGINSCNAINLLIRESQPQSPPASLSTSCCSLCPWKQSPVSNPFHLPQSYEPDELTKEMAHLEGLMKDLNAITTAWPPSPGHDSRLFHKSWDLALEHKELYSKKNTEEEGQHIESIPRKQRNQLVHLCYSWSKRDDLPGHHPVTKSHQVEFHLPAESRQDGTQQAEI